MDFIKIDEWATGDVLAECALTFAARRVEAATKIVKRIKLDETDRMNPIRRKVARRAIEQAQNQLRAAMAILEID